jgi:hypothetical protein
VPAAGPLPLAVGGLARRWWACSLARLQRVTIAASAGPEGVASAVLAYACAVGGTDEPRRGDDPDNRAEEVELKDVASSKRARDEPSDERAGDAKQHGEPSAYPLAAGQHKPRDEANDDPDDDETKDLHGILISGASAPKQPPRRASVMTDRGIRYSGRDTASAPTSVSTGL